MSKIYFIDSENVGDYWITMLDAIAPEDEILVFYTRKSPYVSYAYLIRFASSLKRPVFIECSEGNNGLDFQLTSELGYRVCEDPGREFVIVSRDNGFDAVIKYWRKRNITISRIKGKSGDDFGDLVPSEGSAVTASSEETDTAQPARSGRRRGSRGRRGQRSHTEEKPAENIQDEEGQISDGAAELSGSETCEAVPAPGDDAAAAAAIADEKNDASAEGEVIDDNAKELLYLIGRDNLSELHEALLQIYGPAKCKIIYNSFKEDQYSGFLSQHEQMSQDEKADRYCSILFSLADPVPEMPEDFAANAVTAWRKKKNLNSLRASLMGRYGKEAGSRYYQIVKAHIKILDKIR